jgi:hypothetical protein
MILIRIFGTQTELKNAEIFSSAFRSIEAQDLQPHFWNPDTIYTSADYCGHIYKSGVIYRRIFGPHIFSTLLLWTPVLNSPPGIPTGIQRTAGIQL